MQPSRGLNFGPVAFNAGTMTKTFELKNEGEFEFVFAVQVLHDNAWVLMIEGTDLRTLNPQRASYVGFIYASDCVK